MSTESDVGRCAEREPLRGQRCEKPAGHDSFCWHVTSNAVLAWGFGLWPRQADEVAS